MGFSLDLGLVLLSHIVGGIVGTAMAGGNVSPSAGFQFTIVMLLLTLILPSLVAGWMAGSNGAKYGLVLGTLPTAFAWLSGMNAPVLFLAIYEIIAVLGGLAGQSLPGSGRWNSPDSAP